MKKFGSYFLLLIVLGICFGCGEPEPGTANTNVAPETEKTQPDGAQGSSTQANVQTD